MGEINKIKIYQFCDIVPVASTATNFMTLIFKATVALGYNAERVKNPGFAKHLHDKSTLRCVTLLIPVVGNAAFIVYKIVMFAAQKCCKSKAGSENVQEAIENPVTQENHNLRQYTLILAGFKEQCEHYKNENEKFLEVWKQNKEKYRPAKCLNIDLILRAFKDRLNPKFIEEKIRLNAENETLRNELITARGIFVQATKMIIEKMIEEGADSEAFAEAKNDLEELDGFPI